MTTRARQTKQRLQIERFRLQFGPYAPPKVPRKNLLLCEMRGYLKVSPNWSDGLIPWPRRWRTGSIILCGDLVRAVKMEPVEAVCYHWGVCRNVVQNWRHALGVPEFNPGTSICVHESSCSMCPTSCIFCANVDKRAAHF